jgi:transcription termination factor NusB
VFYVEASGPVPVDEFDLAVKGDKKLPPVGAAGLTFDAVSEKRETLQADLKRMADEILKRLNSINSIIIRVNQCELHLREIRVQLQDLNQDPIAIKETVYTRKEYWN